MKMSNKMHYRTTGVYCLLLILFLSSCMGKRGHVQVSVQLKNLDQADLYVYTSDGNIPQVDTIHLMKGRGEYETPIKELTTLHLVYPNFQELTIWAGSGDVIKVKGDAQNLKAVSVKGNTPNKLYTKFRRQTAQMMPDSVRIEAEAFIRQNLTSPVSLLLLEQNFANGQDLKTGEELCQLLEQEESVDGRQLDQVRKAIQASKILRVGATLPAFQLKDEEGNIITDKQYRGRYLLLNFWANWMGNSSSNNYAIRRTLESHCKNFSMLNYNLETNRSLTNNYTTIPDSLSWTDFCDYKAWDSPLVKKLGINNLPTTIFVDPKGKILAVGTNYQRDIQPAIDKVDGK